jgi:dihydroorotase
MTDRLTIRRPDDWHVHLRDGAMLKAVAPYTARQFARAIVMPNLDPPVTAVATAAAYRERILAAVAPADFMPLMTCYLTDEADPAELTRGHANGVFAAAKLYPANATTNSAHGVTEMRNIFPALAAMQRIGMPLLIHGEVTDPDVDVFDREKAFIDRVLNPLVRDFPELKIVLEHITTADAVQFVESAGTTVAATITPQHLVLNRNALFAGGLPPRPALPNSSSAPTARRMRARRRRAHAAARASSTPLSPSKPTPRCSQRRVLSAVSKPSRPNTARVFTGCPSTKARSHWNAPTSKCRHRSRPRTVAWCRSRRAKPCAGVWPTEATQTKNPAAPRGSGRASFAPRKSFGYWIGCRLTAAVLPRLSTSSSNSTRSPSLRPARPARSTAEIWTKASG